MRPRPRETVLTPLDVALLEALSAEPNLVRACRRLGVLRDRGVYRLARLARAAGGPVATTRRGGPGAGATRLTPLGRRLLRRGRGATVVGRPGAAGPAPSATILRGRYRARPAPSVTVGGRTLWVGFRAREGETLSLAVDPEAILVARARFPTSARNVLDGRVESVRPAGTGRRALRVRSGAIPLSVSVTPDAVRSLGLRPGRRVVLYVKATALRRVGGPTRGSPRS